MNRTVLTFVLGLLVGQCAHVAADDCYKLVDPLREIVRYQQQQARALEDIARTLKGRP